MSWEQEYNRKFMSAEEAVDKLVKSNSTVVIGCLNIAAVPLNAMMKKIEDGKLEGITAVGDLLTTPFEFSKVTFPKETFRYKAYFWGGYERAGSKSKNCTFTPMQFHNYSYYLKEVVKPDLGMVQVSPPDENGYCNLGPLGCGMGSAILQSCPKLICQVNQSVPQVCGEGITIHVSQVEAFVEGNEEMPMYPMTPVTPVEERIAGYITELVPDGACIQLGLGGMANAIGYGLRDKKDLGVHTEMFTESMAHLHDIGIITNSRKKFMAGVSVAGFTLGDQKQYDYVRMNKQLCFCGHEITNDVTNIAMNDNVISINNALNIDLSGQVCAEAVGFRQYSGTGGQVDFVRGALYSKGGKSFIAVSAATEIKGNLTSRIVLSLEPGTPITTLRTEVQYVVTEYGCVNLFGEDIPTRAEKLISIAHPQFREGLEFEAKKLGLIY